METITKEIYYHINKGKKLLIGDTLDIGNTYNNFYHEIYNSEYLNNNKDANEYLVEMQKNKSTHNKEWVYGTYSKAISVIFLSSKGNDLYYSLSGDGKDYPIELVERKKGMFKDIFNISGSIYRLNSTNFKENMTGWSAEVISENDEEVVSEEHIENVYALS